MPDLSFKSSLISHLPVKVWVLAPHVQTNDENIDYYYDFTQSIAEYAKTFTELELQWKWQLVTIDSYEDVINEILIEKLNGFVFPIVLNICDGDETNRAPGISVVNMLEKNKLVYTGAEAFFYNITTSKIAMKKAFDKAKISNAKWQAILTEQSSTKNIFEKLGTPIIVKPSISGGSMGVGIKNVVDNDISLKNIVGQMFAGYRGWDLSGDGLVAESFVAGKEYTSFIVGNYKNPETAIIYHPVERVFHPSLPERERFLSFDRLWEIYEEEKPMPNDENFYDYKAVDTNKLTEVNQLSWDAFASVKGTGYARIDIREDKETGKLYVLEVNAQCGISEDEAFTSIGAILKASNKTFTMLVAEIIEEAIERKQQFIPKRKKLRVERA